MSSANVTRDLAAELSVITWRSVMFTRYWCIIMFIIGFIGHTLNICIFIRPALRSNPCARYFMASAVAGYAVILVLLPVRLLQFGYGTSIFIPSTVLCKLLTFLFSWIRILPCWFIALASVDRFLCSSLSPTLRRWSSVRASKWLISLAVVIVGLSQIPILIFYTVTLQPGVCLGQPNLFQKINGFFTLIVWSLIPSSAMLVFGLLTIRHVKQSSQAMVRQRSQRMKFIDRQLIQITLVQSILFGLTSASGSLGGTFNILDDNSRRDPLELAKQSFIGNILSFVGLLGPCVSFYLCTLSSQIFRRELLDLLHRRHATRVHPMQQR